MVDTVTAQILNLKPQITPNSQIRRLPHTVFHHPHFCPVGIAASAEGKPFACNHRWNPCNLRLTSPLGFFGFNFSLASFSGGAAILQRPAHPPDI